MKFNLKETWKKVAHALAGEAPVNSMTSFDVQHIQKKVRAETEFDVACMDTRLVNGRKNVGLVMPEATPAETQAKAQAVFIAAAKERNIEITADKIIRYVPGTTSTPGRFVQPRPKTW